MSSTSIRLTSPEGAGHWLAEQAPEEKLKVLTEFLTPHRKGGGGLR